MLTEYIPPGYSQNAITPPLKQIKNGVMDSEITCPNEFVLVFKIDDLSPACVRQYNIPLLIERGWAMMINVNGTNMGINPTSRDYDFVFLVNYDSPQYNKTASSIVKHLKGGDYLMVEGHENSQIQQDIRKIRSLANSGVNVGQIRIYNNIGALVKDAASLPPGIGYIGYDYEEGSGFSPEFTTNETSSIRYFDEARYAVEQYNIRTGGNAKSLVLLPYGELERANWDWGLAAKNADMVDIQFQAFIKDRKFLDYVFNSVAQIKQEAPSTKVFVQLSLVEKRGTAKDNLDAINTIRKLPIDAFLMFYHPSHTTELDQFFQILPK